MKNKKSLIILVVFAVILAVVYFTYGWEIRCQLCRLEHPYCFSCCDTAERICP